MVFSWHRHEWRQSACCFKESSMPHPACRLVLALMGIIVGGDLCSALADDADAVKEKLFQAKKEFDGEVKKFKQTIEESFDKREEAARAAGDKKAVDTVKSEREAFAKTGETTAAAHAASKQKIAAARIALDQAYTAAVKDYVRVKLDKEADTTEKERQEFQLSTAFLFGKQTFVSTLKPFDIRVGGQPFQKDTNKFKLNGEPVPHSIFCHPDDKGGSSVSYSLPSKGIVAFRATVGIPKYIDGQPEPFSKATFEVLGDGKSLWKSEPVSSTESFQSCTIKLDKVKTLTLRTHCGNFGWVHGVWFAPTVAE